jgi:pyruvate dehydrogenase E1 component alpha subunit
MLECRTYRFYGHTVFDNPLTYRTAEEEASWRARDPLKQFRERVVPEGIISDAELDRLDQEAEDLMEEAIRFADASPMPEPGEIYEDVYVDYPLEMMRRGINM